MILDADDYTRWDAVEMARLVRAGDVQPADLTETALHLIDRLPRLNAVADVCDAP